MYLSKNGLTSHAVQYECKNISQVKNTINEITNTISQNNDWKDICLLSKNSSSQSADYICFIDGSERDCSVNIWFDNSCKSYFVWIEI